MITISESCACGARVTVSSVSREEALRTAQEFREAHSGCLQQRGHVSVDDYTVGIALRDGTVITGEEAQAYLEAVGKAVSRDIAESIQRRYRR